MKRMIAALTAALLLAALILPVSAAGEEDAPDGRETVLIDSVQSFRAFAEACADTSYSENRIFSLQCNLDLGGGEFSPVPYFAGEFRGNGHSITGLSITRPGSRQGLFRTVAPGAEIAELSVSGSVKPGGSRSLVGGIAGVNGGRIRDCRFEGSVSGREQVGGICGCAETGAELLRCTVSGSVTGEHEAGGVCGLSGGLVEDCVSEASVNVEAVVPEREAGLNLSGFDLSSFSAENYLDITDLGGVCGKNTGVVLRCENRGNVGYHYAGYNVGGICGLTAGFISGCTNSGEVRGRRDVGGIAGQLIPDIRFDFSEGKLDDVETALQNLNWSIASASSAVSDSGDEMKTGLETVAERSRTLNTELAAFLRQLADNGESFRNGIRLDPDTGELTFDGWGSVDSAPLTAAMASLLGEYDAVLSMAGESTGELMQRLLNVSASISSVMGQLNRAMQRTDSGVEELDLSVTEGYGHEKGAVDGCFSRGGVCAEDCAGGVVGSVAYELDFDKEDVSGLSDALAAEIKEVIFAVLRDCESSGSVEVKNEYAGGTVGKMELGAVLDCIASGSVRSLNGGHVGGIAGKTAGTVKDCYARSALSGNAYVGGIAGEAENVLSCTVSAAFEDYGEYAGALAGWVGGETADCVYVRCTPAGVDGVSYSGKMSAVSYEELLDREELPALFRNVTVRFIGPDGEACETLSLPYGASVSELPEIGRDGERYWLWDRAELGAVCRDTEVHGAYYSPVHTLSDGAEVPLILVEGSFYEGQELTVTKEESDTEEGRFAAYRISVSGYEGTLTVRMFAEGPGKIWLHRSDGTRQELSAETDGRYRVFSLENGARVSFEPGTEKENAALLPACLGAGGVLCLLLLITRKKRRASGTKDDPAGA